MDWLEATDRLGRRMGEVFTLGMASGLPGIPVGVSAIVDQHLAAVRDGCFAGLPAHDRDLIRAEVSAKIEGLRRALRGAG